jgi:hypothetical protein
MSDGHYYVCWNCAGAVPTYQNRYCNYVIHSCPACFPETARDSWSEMTAEMQVPKVIVIDPDQASSSDDNESYDSQEDDSIGDYGDDDGDYDDDTRYAAVPLPVF